MDKDPYHHRVPADHLANRPECQILRNRGWLTVLISVSLIVISTGCDERSDVTVSVAPTHPHPASTALKSGVDWLLSQQASDGGWHSETYGMMKGGVGNTALVLAALSEVPTSLNARIPSAFERGVAFLTANLDRQGLVRAPDGSADYPVYATALTIIAVEKRDYPLPEAIKSQMCRGLLAAQRSGANGWTTDNPVFGGWGIRGIEGLSPENSSPSNISVTAHVLLALAKTKTLTPQTRTDALDFLARCQVLNTGLPHDGGFAFTGRPDDPLNKAGILRLANSETKGRPYRTATYDGALSLLACGIPITDRRLAAALAWLHRDESFEQTSAADAAGSATVRHGLEHYEFVADARLCRLTANRKLSGNPKRQLESLISRQRHDGSWSSPHTLMREDDPLIATAALVFVLALEMSPD